MPKYKCGLYIGRFQPIHCGHFNIINTMLDECDTVIVAVGSAQEYGTKKNPFSYAHRASLISSCFIDDISRLYIIPVQDREHPSNDPSWGDYLLNTVKRFTGLTPDVIYEGVEEERNTWYQNYDIPIRIFMRSIIPVTATKIRETLLRDDQCTFRYFTPYAISTEYDKLRKELLKCYESQET